MNKRVVNKRYGNDGLLAWLYPLIWLPCMCVVVYALHGLIIKLSEEFSVHLLLPLALFVVLFLFLITVAVAWVECFEMVQCAKFDSKKLFFDKFFTKADSVNLSEIEEIQRVKTSRVGVLFSNISLTKNSYKIKLANKKQVFFSGDMEGLDEFILDLSSASGIRVEE